MLDNFFSQNYAVYEALWKNMVKPEEPQMATGTHSECLMLIAS